MTPTLHQLQRDARRFRDLADHALELANDAGIAAATMRYRNPLHRTVMRLVANKLLEAASSLYDVAVDAARERDDHARTEAETIEAGLRNFAASGLLDQIDRERRRDR